MRQTRTSCFNLKAKVCIFLFRFALNIESLVGIKLIYNEIFIWGKHGREDTAKRYSRTKP